MKFADLVLVAGALENLSDQPGAWQRNRAEICNGALVYSNHGD